ncbi:MAG: IS5 family transposase, partial [Elainellaceae cyanobacterium]
MEATYKSYPSNLSDGCWTCLCPYLPAAKPGGRPRSVNLRAVLDAIFYVLRSGCAWRMIPGDLSAWQTVYTYFCSWQRAGVWERINRYLREWVRRKANRRASPSAAIIDSQSAKIGCLTSNSCGFDGGKKVKGRKRHILVDTPGLVILVVVTAVLGDSGIGLFPAFGDQPGCIRGGGQRDFVLGQGSDRPQASCQALRRFLALKLLLSRSPSTHSYT